MNNLKKTRKMHKRKTRKTIKIKSSKKMHKKKTRKTKSGKKTQKGGAFTLTICEPDKCIITEANKVNNSTIFKIVYEGCMRHFPVSDEKLDFQFLYLDNQFDKTGVLVKRHADTDPVYIETIATFIRNNQPIYSHRDFLEQHNIIQMMWSPTRSCEKEIDISETEPKIKELNNLLTEKCDNLSLSLNYVYNINHIRSV